MRLLPFVLALLVGSSSLTEERRARQCVDSLTGMTWYALKDVPANTGRAGAPSWADVALRADGVLEGVGATRISVGTEVMLLEGDRTHLALLSSSPVSAPLGVKLSVPEAWSCEQTRAAFMVIFTKARPGDTPGAESVAMRAAEPAAAPKAKPEPLTPGAAAILRRAEADEADAQKRPGIIRKKCAADWPDDFAMRKYCEDEQSAASEALDERAMLTGIGAKIRAKCARDWPIDFTMRDYCEKEQLEAAASLGE